MRRVAPLTFALVLGLCGAAVAFPAGYLTLDPKEPGEGTLATLDLRGGFVTNVLVLRVARGTKLHPRAVTRRCRNARAAADDCPAASRIGGGTARLETLPDTVSLTVEIDLYLAPRRRTEDIAGLAMVTRAPGRHSYGTGRAFELNPELYPRKGLQLQWERLEKAFFGMRVRHLNVHLGAHRTVQGRRVRLITNPSGCPEGGWPWTIAVGSLHGSQNFFHGAVDCSS